MSKYNTLRDFITVLEEKKELIRIKEVSTIVEITEIHRRVLSEKGPAILFENVITENGRNSIPVLVNLFGTVDRVALGLGIDSSQLREFGKLLAFLRSPEPPKNFKEAIKMLPLLKTVFSMRSRVVKHAPCQEIIFTQDKVDLSIFPIQTCWPWVLVLTDHDAWRVNPQKNYRAIEIVFFGVCASRRGCNYKKSVRRAK